ncbi:flagellar filament capping protein FliD [Nesterenkonia populi]|uniref:flagellar filament capping protein FliD n=1 Tax=Nesterenkonia populi TaxID=1591087 RepID=UPI0011BF74B9|nr:flagellar filament capping protein FliD [Nesterenkonia populi]
MTSMAMPGIATGMDTSAIVDQLMAVEAIPQQQLQQRAAGQNQFLDTLRSLNSQVADLGGTARDASRSDALQHFTASTSTDSVVATASSNAAPGALDFTVDAVAARHTMVTDAVAEWDTTSFTITGADGEAHTIEAASASLNDIVQAINRSDAGINATRVAAGDGTHRLQLAAAETGADGAFTLTGTSIGSTVTAEGADAAVTLWAGTAAEQRITSPTNTFSDLLPGVDVTVSQPSAAPVTLSIEQDAEASASTAQELMDGLSSVLGFISGQSDVSTEGDEVTASPLTGDSTSRAARQRLVDAAIQPINGQSLSSIGIEISRNGEITFDEARFTQALANDREGTEEMFAAFAGRIADTAVSLSDRYDGQITSRITGQEASIRRTEDQIATWDTRLANRRAALDRTYASLEVAIQQMNSQMEYMQSQLAGLPQANQAS